MPASWSLSQVKDRSASSPRSTSRPHRDEWLEPRLSRRIEGHSCIDSMRTSQTIRFGSRKPISGSTAASHNRHEAQTEQESGGGFWHDRRPHRKTFEGDGRHHVKRDGRHHVTKGVEVLISGCVRVGWNSVGESRRRPAKRVVGERTRVLAEARDRRRPYRRIGDQAHRRPHRRRRRCHLRGRARVGRNGNEGGYAVERRCGVGQCVTGQLG